MYIGILSRKFSIVSDNRVTIYHNASVLFKQPNLYRQTSNQKLPNSFRYISSKNFHKIFVLLRNGFSVIDLLV